jgi:hypothetical protein
LGFGQVPIYLFFANKIQARDTVKSGLIYNRLKDLEPDASTIDLSNWLIAPITLFPFTKWWSEWQDHLFCLSASIYYKNLDADYREPEDEVCTFPKFFQQSTPLFPLINFLKTITTGSQYTCSDNEQERPINRICPSIGESPHRPWSSILRRYYGREKTQVQHQGYHSQAPSPRVLKPSDHSIGAIIISAISRYPNRRSFTR